MELNKCQLVDRQSLPGQIINCTAAPGKEAGPTVIHKEQIQHLLWPNQEQEPRVGADTEI
jgi:hypothetical protein